MVEIFGPEMVHLLPHQLMCNKMTLIVAHELTSLASVSLGFLHFHFLIICMKVGIGVKNWRGGGGGGSEKI